MKTTVIQKLRMICIWHWPLVLYALITCAITAPWLRPGYLFFLDMVWGPDPEAIDWGQPTLAWSLVLRSMRFVLPGDAAQKVLLFGLLFAIPSSLYILARSVLPAGLRNQRWWAAGSGLIYLVNPYVYERLAAGQWMVLAGYAFLPLALWSLYRLLEYPTRRHLLAPAVLLAGFPLVSLHGAYIGYWLCIGIILAYVLTGRLRTRRQYIISGCAVIGAILVVNAFWIFGGITSNIIGGISSADFRAFATVPDFVGGVWLNVAAGYGFWQQGILLPKHYIPTWRALTLVMLGLLVVGVWRAVRGKHPFWMAIVCSLPISFVIAIGYGSEAVRPLIDLLRAWMPGFAGLRDTAKFIGVIMLGWALLLPLTAAWLWQIAGRPGYLQRYGLQAGSVLVFLLPILCAWPIMGGLSGQIRPRPYPPSWQNTRHAISSKVPLDSRILILPWHHYLELPMSDYRLVAVPSQNFFGRPTVTSQVLDSSYLDAARPKDEWDGLVFRWLNDMSTPAADRQFLRDRKIGAIVLIKTQERWRYRFLNADPTLDRIYDSPDIAVYQLRPN